MRVRYPALPDEQLASHWVQKIKNALAEVGLSSRESSFDLNDKTLGRGFQKDVLFLIAGQKPAIKTTTQNDNSQ